ncbi:hypothetical protein AB1Y20_009674 [Prymnesium parvum]|uniref:VPS9 domain-containing protein n=1 Tax=Prymnesium parvum TaxID=97485 RepID=A0AB34K2S5_PRYPA
MESPHMLPTRALSDLEVKSMNPAKRFLHWLQHGSSSARGEQQQLDGDASLEPQHSPRYCGLLTRTAGTAAQLAEGAQTDWRGHHAGPALACGSADDAIARFEQRAAQLRAEHRPDLLRLERTLAQLQLALHSTREEREQSPLGSEMDSLDRREACLLRHCERLSLQLDALHAKRLALKDGRVRAARLRALLERCRCVYHDAQIQMHAPQPELQAEFDALVCSPHAREGRLLSRWAAHFLAAAPPPHPRPHSPAADGAAGGRNRALSAPLGGEPPPPPHAEPSAAVTLDFIEYISRLIAAQYSLQRYLPQISLCASRLLLPMVVPPLWQAALSRNARRDRHLAAQQRWLRAMPPKSFAVDPRFCADERPGEAAQVSGAALLSSRWERRGEPRRAAPTQVPAAAARALGDFCYLLVPADMLLCLYRAIQLLHSAAARAASIEPQAIGADALLPLLVWVVIHAELPHAFAAVDFAKQLCTREQTFSELGYYLACFEAAIAFVVGATEASLGAEAAPGGTSSFGWTHPSSRSRTFSGTADPPVTPPDGAAAVGAVEAREQLASFLHEERVVDELVASLTL